MKNYSKKMALVLMMFMPVFASATEQSSTEKSDVTVVQFAEKDNASDPYSLRFLFSGSVLRIDDNTDDSDFVIYDDTTRNIHSINHEDKTILVIEYEKWLMPEFDFQRNESWKEQPDAPKIDGKKVLNYWLSANEAVCVEAHVAEGFLNREAAIMQRYRQALSSAQVKSLVATPEEMRTPCMLSDQVYDNGGLFSKGFPLQQKRSNGVQQVMTDFKTGQKFSSALFELPADYKHYSMGDDLTLGKPE